MGKERGWKKGEEDWLQPEKRGRGAQSYSKVKRARNWNWKKG